MGRDQGRGVRGGDRRRRDDHPPPRRRPRPPPVVRPPATRPFAEALRAAKRRVDPAGVLNPGVLIDPLAFALAAWQREQVTGCPAPAIPEARRPTPRRGLLAAARRHAPAGVDQEPARLRGAAVLAAASTGRRRSPTRPSTFVAFCAVSSAGYLFNDLHDAPARPPPSRQAPSPDRQRRARAGRAAALRWSLLAAVALALPLAAVEAEVAGLVAAYGVITTAYSLGLKRLVIIDVMTIASLFILRVVAGAVAVDAQASEFLLVCTGDAGPLPRLHEAPPGGDARGRPGPRLLGIASGSRRGQE